MAFVSDLYVLPAKQAARRASNPRLCLVRAVRAAAGESGNGESFWEKLDRATWQFFQGRKEEIWQPDMRPQSERNAPLDKSKSTLSWSNTYAATILQRSGQWTPAEARRVSAPQIPPREDSRAASALTTRGGTSAQDRSFADQVFKAQPILTEANSRPSDAWVDQVQRLADYADVPEQPDERAVTGKQLAEFCYAKYGYYYDMTIIHAKPFGDEEDRRQVAFNIYGAYLGDISTFKMTEQQYLDRLDRVAGMLTCWDQAWFIREFFRAPIVPRRGLPSTPRADTAVTLRLNTSPTWKYVNHDIVKPWFTY
eukprot:Plantae.Rhodophyta-Rhodochaete_pulchella.ctg17024.p1 GENE.Plantae.Rhodophyta-Rhodochaete_pulchella.ctg17024~~Plantae.Rhodophyta-Rhodochaete_pulchella.ctg17024.p1  ORF type:complete len:310 (+),score=19.08 Plantae.Rhodophyta-Rhodochaete_pulchella.ctg17024:405-1334(+)